jgi:glycosyltransferase involved in cell wall biosynthesis
VYLGHTSPQRGFHFLPEIIARCRTDTIRPQFAVQVQNREGAAIAGVEAAVHQVDGLAGDDVRIVEGALSSAAYLELLHQADIVLLPYSPRFYGFGSSGVFTEAASAAKVIVVSPNTVPARQGKEFGLGVVTASEWTAAAMTNAIRQALADFPRYQAMAQTAAPRFREDQCARTLWDRVLAGFPAARDNPPPPISAAA